MNLQPPWNSLEIAKLTVAALIPVAVAILGIYLTRIAKRFEHLQWRNQRLVEKRISVYDDLAPQLNDLLCYFTFVGCWKELTPPEVVAIKRKVDKKIYLAAPLFSADFFVSCNSLIALCFAPFQGWGVDARLRTATGRRRSAAGNNWNVTWDNYFTADNDVTDPKAIQAAYQRVMEVFARDIALAPVLPVSAVGGLPSNIA